MTEPRRFVLIGHPVGHSMSPAIHTVAYRELGEDALYELVDCPDEAAVRRTVDRIRGRDLHGANVTVPWKRVALALADRADPLASEAGAANVLALDAEGALVAYNTDIMALSDDLCRHRQESRRALVLGNGGAALAAVVACRALGMDEISVSARRYRPETPIAEWPAASRLRELGGTPHAWPDAGATLEVARGADVILQATSAGMKGAASGEVVRDVIPWDQLDPATLAYDLVYNPPETPFLAAAREQGLRYAGGLGMLVGQAARAIEIWFGVAPPQAPLRAAAEVALFGMVRR